MQRRELDPPERAVLAILYQYNLALSPDSFSANFSTTLERTGELFDSLQERGFLQKAETGQFELSERGEEYVETKLKFRSGSFAVC